MQPTSCPDANKANEFGVKANPYMSCSVYHAKEVRDLQTKTFTNRDSAQAFYKRAKASESYAFNFNSQLVQEVKIDSIKIK